MNDPEPVLQNKLKGILLYELFIYNNFLVSEERMHHNS
jgi:hypothetical protein